jgi:hypothetical protein
MRSVSGIFAILSMFGFLFSGCGHSDKPEVGNGFVDGATFRVEGRKGAIHLVELGPISFPSGKVAPKDTMMLDEEAPLNREVPRAEARATAAVARFSNGDERVAFLRVRFKEDVVVRHELAKRLISDKWHESYQEAYPVDSGFGGFVDHAAQTNINQVLEDSSAPRLKQLHDELKARQKDTWSWSNVEIIPGVRLLVVSSGFGDGAYKTYYGLNSQGDIVELVTDFAVF